MDNLSQLALRGYFFLLFSDFNSCYCKSTEINPLLLSVMKYNNNSSKMPTIKQEFGKLYPFHQKRNQIKPMQSQLFNFDGKRNQNLRLKPSKPEIAEKEVKEKLAKNWWIHVWQGLVMDKRAKHQKAMRQAVWLYLYLLIAANWKSGVLYRRLSTIISETGFHERSISRWLNLLREKGYIETHSTGRALQISITKWKPIFRKKEQLEN